MLLVFMLAGTAGWACSTSKAGQAERKPDRVCASPSPETERNATATAAHQPFTPAEECAMFFTGCQSVCEPLSPNLKKICERGCLNTLNECRLHVVPPKAGPQ